MPSLLVLRALGLGDTLAAVPALRALRTATDGHVTLAGPLGPAQLLKDAGLIDRVVEAQGLQTPIDCGWPPDIAVNFHGRGPQSHRLLQATEPERLVAFANQDARVEGPQWRADEHERARWCRLVSETWSVGADPDDVLLPALDSPVDGDYLVVHPGAASGARRWPADRWVQVIQKLAADHRVILTGGPDERDLATQIAEDSGLDHGDVLAGETNTEQLAAIVSGASQVLCGDTGCAHLAYAYGVPSVVLFGPVSPQLWGPPNDERHIALWHGEGAGDPHAQTPDERLLNIEPADVLAHAL